MRERRLNEFKGVILVAAGLIVLASLASFTPFDLSFYTSHPNIPPKNFIRTFGAYLAGLLLFLFGWSSYLIPAIIIFVGVSLFRQEKPYLSPARILGMLVLLLSLSSFIGMFGQLNEAIGFSRGGFLGLAISRFVIGYLVQCFRLQMILVKVGDEYQVGFFFQFFFGVKMFPAALPN